MRFSLLLMFGPAVFLFVSYVFAHIHAPRDLEITWPHPYDEKPVSLPALRVGSLCKDVPQRLPELLGGCVVSRVPPCSSVVLGVSGERKRLICPLGGDFPELTWRHLSHPASLIPGCYTQRTKSKAVSWTAAQGFGFIQNFSHHCHDLKNLLPG